MDDEIGTRSPGPAGFIAGTDPLTENFLRGTDQRGEFFADAQLQIVEQNVVAAQFFFLAYRIGKGGGFGTGAGYVNKNIYVHRADADLWNVNTLKTESVLVNYSVPEPYSSTAVNIDLLSPMSWAEVKKWVDFPVGRRGEDYVAFKEAKTEECIRLVEKRLPELRGAVERVFTSTPLSYQSYISSAEGCAFGIRKDYNNPMYTVLTPRTPISNLLLTGQSLNLHGVLGVSMTSFLTCAEILGMDKINEELKIKD